MSIPAPPIDGRSFDDLVAETETLIHRYTCDCGKDTLCASWRDGAGGARDALIRIFCHMAEKVVHRLNRIPERSLLAFLDLIGVTRQPPQAARVPLTFTPASGAESEALVPAATTVAATQLEGESGPVLFETERDLVLTPARLTHCFTRDPVKDTYADRSREATGENDKAFPGFKGEEHMPHRLYLGSAELFGIDAVKKITLTLKTKQAEPSALEIAWSYQTVDGPRKHPGKTSLTDSHVLKNVPPLAATEVDGQKSVWLCATLTSRLPRESLPSLASVKAKVEIKQKNLSPGAAFTNQTPVDPTVDCFPFGEKPKVGDAFYLRQDEVFAKKDAQVTMSVTLTNPGNENELPLPAKASTELKLIWERWNRKTASWSVLIPTTKTFSDTTKSFTCDGVVTFPCPQIDPVEVNGQLGHWIRVRIAKGNYGREAFYKRDGNGYVLHPATFRPPSLANISFSYEYTREIVPTVISENAFSFTRHDPPKPFTPFIPMDTDRPELFLGFQRPGAETGFANRATTLFFVVAEDATKVSGKTSWQYHDGARWRRLGVRDETRGFIRSGTVTFIGPADFRRSRAFGQKAFWLRVRWDGEKDGARPLLRRVLTNTIWATQSLTIREETLGSGNGEPNQVFRPARAPVLSGERIEVRESGDAWVSWQRVADFLQSGPADRHYTLDRFTGEIRFGDGRRGRVPPRGSANVRAAVYRTGGGSRGNRPAGTIQELKVAVPYVEGVTNVLAARGGVDGEGLAAAVERGPKQIRHRDRAVVAADFEDLAFDASPRVARARAIPARDSKDVGRVGLIIVANDPGPQPDPDRDLLNRVRRFLESRIPAGIVLCISGPKWLKVSVTAEIVPVSPELGHEVRDAVAARLERMIHPLDGGPDGRGWAFGRKPYRSDFIALIESTPGVDHVRSLSVTESGDVTHERFLITSGEHALTVAL